MNIKKIVILVIATVFICVLVFLLLTKKPPAIEKPQQDEVLTEHNPSIKEIILVNPDDNDESPFTLVEKLSLNNESPSVKELEALLSKYIEINNELNKKPSYDSSVVKFMMSESILNGVTFNLVNELDVNSTEKACGFLDSSKELFVDVMYNVSVMLNELGYSLQDVPMTVSKNSFSSMGHWREASLIMRAAKFNRQLKDYSESKDILSLNDRFTGKSKSDDFPSKWSDYIGRPESAQHIDSHAIYSYWAKYKIYCLYKKLEPQYASDEDMLYSALDTEASSEPWLSGKNATLYHKSVWKSTIDLAPTGVPKKIQALRFVNAPEWKK